MTVHHTNTKMTGNYWHAYCYGCGWSSPHDHSTRLDALNDGDEHAKAAAGADAPPLEAVTEAHRLRILVENTDKLARKLAAISYRMPTSGNRATADELRVLAAELDALEDSRGPDPHDRRHDVTLPHSPYKVDQRWAPGASRGPVPKLTAAHYSAAWVDRGDDVPDIVIEHQGIAYNDRTDSDVLLQLLAMAQLRLVPKDIARNEPHEVIADEGLHVWMRKAGGFVYVDAWLELTDKEMTP